MAREVLRRGRISWDYQVIVFSQIKDRIFERLGRNTSSVSQFIATFSRQRPTVRLVYSALEQRRCCKFAFKNLPRSPKASASFKRVYLLGFAAVGFVAFNEKKMSDHIAETIKKADEIYEKGKLEENYKVLLELKDSGNADALWRLARACRRLSQLPSFSNEEKKQFTYSGLEYAKKALEADDKNFHCQKWSGIMLSEVGDYEGVKQKITNAYVIKEHFEKAIEIDPTDPTSRHLLGRWCFSSADLPWYQRKIAEAIFASPPKSTYEEALEHFEKAEELSPGFYSANLLMIARCYINMKKKENAIPWLEKLKEFDAVTADDIQAQKEGATLM